MAKIITFAEKMLSRNAFLLVLNVFSLIFYKYLLN